MFYRSVFLKLHGALMTKTFLSTLLITAVLILPSQSPSWAQQPDFGFGKSNSSDEENPEEKEFKILDPYDEQYRPNPSIGLKDINKPPSPLPESTYSVSFKNALTGREGDFEMAISSPGAVTGCLATKNPTITKSAMGKKLKIEITSNVVTANTAQTRYGHYSCPVTANAQLANIILNRDDLIQGGIQEIMLEEEDAGLIANYEITVNQNNIVMKPRFPVYEEPYLEQDKDKATLWFYPAGTLKLFNASLDMSNPDAYLQIVGLARQKGLVPLEEAFPGYERLQKIAKKQVLVVDQNKLFASEFQDQNNAFTLGMININEVYIGPDGPYDRMIEKPVFARLAGTDD